MFLSNSIKFLKMNRNLQGCVSLFQKVGIKRVMFGYLVKNLSNTIGTEYKDVSKSVQRELEIMDEVDEYHVNSNTDDTNYNYEEFFKEIAQGDPTVERELKKLEFEVALMRDENENMPTIIKEVHWRKLLKMNSILERKNYLEHLHGNEIKNIYFKRREKRRRIYNTQKLGKFQRGDFKYGLGFNSLLEGVFDRSVFYLGVERMMRALMFSQHVVLDCSYDEYMSDNDAKECALQLSKSFKLCIYHPSPLHVKLCNINFESNCFKHFRHFLPEIKKNFFPWDFHSESYLDLYPKENIVYLTPYTTSPLNKFSCDDVYVIGAFEDKTNQLRASLAKAVENNLRMAKLPLDTFILGSNSLPIHVVLGILCDLNFYKDWNAALKRTRQWYSTLDVKKKCEGTKFPIKRL